MTHEDLKMAGGDHVTRPLKWRTALVIVVMMYSPSALWRSEERWSGEMWKVIDGRDEDRSECGSVR